MTIQDFSTTTIAIPECCFMKNCLPVLTINDGTDPVMIEFHHTPSCWLKVLVIKRIT